MIKLDVKKIIDLTLKSEFIYNNLHSMFEDYSKIDYSVVSFEIKNEKFVDNIISEIYFYSEPLIEKRHSVENLKKYKKSPAMINLFNIKVFNDRLSFDLMKDLNSEVSINYDLNKNYFDKDQINKYLSDKFYSKNEMLIMGIIA